MPLVLSQILDRETVCDARRLRLYDEVPRLGSLDFYVRRTDLESIAGSRDASLLSGDLTSLAPLNGRLSSIRVFLPPYGPRTEEWEYPEEAFGELEAVLRVAERLRDLTRPERVALSFHHVTEWPIAIDREPRATLRAALAADRQRACEFVRRVAARCAEHGVVAALENVAPVRNDHPFPGARHVPRLETGFCGPLELEAICGEVPELGCVLDVCHLALGCEAERAGLLPRLNRLDLDGDPLLDEPRPYRFAGVVERLATRLEGAHLAGCAGPDKRRHEGGVPGDPGDAIDLQGLLSALARAAAGRTLAVTLEIADGHTEPGLERVTRAVRRVASVIDRLTPADR